MYKRYFHVANVISQFLRLCFREGCPQLCPANYFPLCDSSGKTWSNKCTYDSAVCYEGYAATIVRQGECSPPDIEAERKPPTIVLTDQSQPSPLSPNKKQSLNTEFVQVDNRAKNNVPPPYQGKIPTVTILEDASGRSSFEK